MLPVAYPVWLRLPLLWETCQNWLGFSSGSNCWWHCRKTVGLYQWTSRKGECWQGLVGLWEHQRAQLLQCEAEKWHITSACSAMSTFPSGFCILALELGVLPGISAVPRSCSLFTAKFSVEIPAGKAYGRLKNVTRSNEKIHEASVMPPLAWTNGWF